MSGARFQQKFINIRERLNNLTNHRHDNLYEKKGTFLGKNLLINGDKSISQRGDFSSPVNLVSGSVYTDKYKVITTLNGQYTNGQFNTEINSRTNFLQATVSNTGIIYTVQEVENYKQFIGRTLTYTAQVRSNINATLTANDGLTSVSNTHHSGNGEWELLTVTFKVHDLASQLFVSVITSASFSSAINAGDYFEVGQEQLEFGDKFTGFEYILPGAQLTNCRRYWYSVVSDYDFDVIGTFVAISTVEMWCALNVTPMQKVIPSLEYQTGMGLSMLGPGSGLMDIDTLAVHTTQTDMTLGKLLLKITGNGFVTGEVNIVQKNNQSTLIGLDGEI